MKTDGRTHKQEDVRERDGERRKEPGQKMKSRGNLLKKKLGKGNGLKRGR